MPFEIETSVNASAITISLNRYLHELAAYLRRTVIRYLCPSEPISLVFIEESLWHYKLIPDHECEQNLCFLYHSIALEKGYKMTQESCQYVSDFYGFGTIRNLWKRASKWHQNL